MVAGRNKVEGNATYWPTISRVGARAVPAPVRFLFAGFLLAIAAVYFWLVTYGTWSLVGSEARGEAFDSLAKHLLSLDAGVDEQTIDWEGLTTGSRTVMYFGPFPALLRIVPNLIFPNMYGLWSRPSCLLAALLSLAAAVAITFAALTAGGRSLNRRSFLYILVVTLGFGLGTPLVYLVSCGRIYHESILWGLCGSLWSVYFIVRLLNGQTPVRRGLLGLAVSFAVTLLSRVTFAIPTALALAVLTLRAIAGELKAPKPRASRVRAAWLLALAVSPAALGGAFQLWYDYDRYGSVWGTMRINTYVHPEEIGGVFNLRRLPSALRSYFGLSASSFSARPPFFRFARVRYANDALFFDWKEETLSLSLGSSWLILGAALGALALVRRPRSTLTVLITLLFAVQALLISSFDFVTERFTAEYMPLLTFLFAVYLGAPVEKRLPKRGVLVPLVVLALLSAVVTVGSTLQWNQAVNAEAPGEYRVRLAQLLYREGTAPYDHATVVQLADLEPLAQQGSLAPMRKNATWDELPIVFKGTHYLSGLGMHATGRATFAVPSRATAFWALVGLPDTTIRCPNGSVVFELRDQDSRVLYRSGTIRTGSDPEQIRVSLRGVERLTLVVDDAGDGTDCDDAAWGMPSFILGAADSGSR